VGALFCNDGHWAGALSFANGAARRLAS
jgi:hypothetical protein